MEISFLFYLLQQRCRVLAALLGNIRVHLVRRIVFPAQLENIRIYLTKTSVFLAQLENIRIGVVRHSVSHALLTHIAYLQIHIAEVYHHLIYYKINF